MRLPQMRVVTCHLLQTNVILHCNFVTNSGRRKFRHCVAYRSSKRVINIARQMDAHSLINWTVGGLS